MSSDPILAGQRIVEASAFVAVPLVGMTPARFGADVARIDHRATASTGGAGRSPATARSSQGGRSAGA